jgi:putative oxidoreductase
MDAGLLIARLILGLAVGAHGAQKLFGWFGGHGLRGTGGYFDTLGFDRVGSSPWRPASAKWAGGS